MDVNPLLQVAPFVQTKVKEVAFLPGTGGVKRWSPNRCSTGGKRAQPYVQRLNMRIIGTTPVPIFALVAQPKTNPPLTGLGDVVTSSAKNIVVLLASVTAVVFVSNTEYRSIPVPMDENGPFDLWLLTTATSSEQRWFLQLQYLPIAGEW